MPVHAERRGDVVSLVLDRPERRNALDVDTCEALAAGVADAVAGGARAIVVGGTGPHFCAGADLTGVEDDRFAAHLRHALDAIAEAPIVSIAAVQGAALGAGTQLAVACDLRVVAPDARFGIPAARLGLMVDHWTVQRVALLAGFGPARAMLLAAEEIGAEEALASGFAQRRGERADAMQWAAQIADLAPLTIAGHKLALGHLEDRTTPDEVSAAFRAAWASADVQEGMAAFAAKRAPKFRGR